VLRKLGAPNKEKKRVNRRSAMDQVRGTSSGRSLIFDRPGRVIVRGLRVDSANNVNRRCVRVIPLQTQ